MQVVEDMEKCFLCFFFSREFLDIIDDQNIDHLVEMKEVVPVVVSRSLRKLGLKFICIYIQNNFFRETLLNLNSDCLSKVSFPKTRISSRFLSNPMNKRITKLANPLVLFLSASLRSSITFLA